MRTPRKVWRKSALGTGMALLTILGFPLVGGWIAGCRATATPPASSSAGKAAMAATDGPALPKIRAVSPEERAEFLGSDRCIQCHRDQEIQTRSRHARTLARADQKKLAPLFRSKAEFSDSLWGLTYRTALKNGRCVIQAVTEDNSEKHEATPEWVFGSGDVGMTFVAQTEDGLTELRLSHFGGANAWEFTPGQKMGVPVKTPLGQSLSKKEQIECFRCHTTALVEEGDKVLPEKSLFGVGCESCHGPGRAHVEAVSRGDQDLKMLRLREVRQQVPLGLCGQCHRSPANVDLRFPGMAAQLPRMQSLALSQSGCFKQGHVTCVSCHDVHQNADDTPRLVYNQRCMSCHTPGDKDQKSCPPRPTGDCVTCHMPRQGVGMPTNPKFRTHWIKVWQNSLEGVS